MVPTKPTDVVTLTSGGALTVAQVDLLFGLTANYGAKIPQTSLGNKWSFYKWTGTIPELMKVLSIPHG
jgi:hypothetical protein